MVLRGNVAICFKNNQSGNFRYADFRKLNLYQGQILGILSWQTSIATMLEALS